MKQSIKSRFNNLWIAICTVSLLALTPMLAHSTESKHHKLVIQVSTDDERTQKIALNNAANLRKLYGKDNVTIEIVAYGPGLSLLTDNSSHTKRILNLSEQAITFSACANTISKVKKETGQTPQLIAGVSPVKAGIARIMELQEQGYAYIRP